MARSQPAGRKTRRQKSSGDSSRSRGMAAGAGESRLFGGPRVLGEAPGWQVPRRALEGLLATYLMALGNPQASLNVQLLDGRECRALNRRFRGKDRSTDVLSFPSLEGRVPRGYVGYLGDLALCLPYAWRKRARFDPDFGGEAAFLLLHGLLHLHGQHHDSPAQDAAMWRLSRRLHPLWKSHAADLRRLAPLKKA